MRGCGSEVAVMEQKIKYYYENVRGLGNIAVTRHAQAEMDEDNISQELFEDVLLNGEEIEEGFGTVWRQGRGIRIIIITPTLFRGAKLVKTVYKIKPQARAK